MYIITELMNEGDLDEYVKTKTFLEEYEASIIMKQLIESLLFLNSLGLIHRDLKPENIMVRQF
jgi:calcium/calmodulin-dependent protein kinase I